MKNTIKFSGIAIAFLFLFSACEKEEPIAPDIEGVYQGTLTSLTTKSSNGSSDHNDATSEITITGDNEIQVHSYAEDFDTTFVINYYMDRDSAYVCYTGDDFEEMYGHMLGDGHAGHMMDDMHNDETQWMHHMDEEHDEGDEHFGGFDMGNHSFSYTFRMNPDDDSDDRHFQGVKQ